MSSLLSLENSVDPAREFLGQGWRVDPETRIYGRVKEFTLSDVCVVEQKDFDASRHVHLCSHAWLALWNLGEDLLLPIFADKSGFFNGSSVVSPQGNRFVLKIVGIQGRVYRFFAPIGCIHHKASHVVVFDKNASY